MNPEEITQEAQRVQQEMQNIEQQVMLYVSSSKENIVQLRICLDGHEEALDANPLVTKEELELNISEYVNTIMFNKNEINTLLQDYKELEQRKQELEQEMVRAQEILESANAE